AVSNRVQGKADLSPALTPTSRLNDLAGAVGKGITRGAIQISDGTTTAVVNLSTADTIGDVINAINNAGVGTVTAAIAPGGQGLQLSAGAGDNISVSEVGENTTAADLGIALPAGAGAG